ncbi:glycine/sarcosine/betaine reductase complex component C subunit alpha [Natranaerobius thermophilus]|uniref:Glycine reductase n=1 Tax=Natranaerobius thermophilus (strain ATCC BAA-1301 / DSM 18059 / JW/NM-WN-LF) TaxID=457570 RepID=B2A5X9_NATTJ|nr:glycine/sarcosine/betaine reductase complex component C subunit alpha [Natranaerobius thermophilus]ACB84072.1 Glycine reductase [Natranaerobius thermophilus JW/NM-WN-LF]
MSQKVKNQLSEVFHELAEALESGQYGKKSKICVTTLGSEHGPEEVVKGAELAKQQNPGIDITLVGPKVDTKLTYAKETDCEETVHKTMEDLLSKGEADASVTMHYNFPVGTATVGKVITPGLGKEMLIATTTGTAGMNRIEAMIKNAIYGVITAKALGNPDPKIGILNVDGAKQVEKALIDLKENGYSIEFAESARQDGGFVMRGNDLLAGSADVMVTDTLTGNLLMKIFSAYTTGGSYESLGYGYGPGVGKDQKQVVNIISRASGAPVIAGAIKFAAEASAGGIVKLTNEEFKKAEQAGLNEILEGSKSSQDAGETEEVTPPPKKPVSEEISGMDIMILEDARKVLWKEDVYAETGMGCAGPVVMVAPEDKEEAEKILREHGYLS